MVRGILHPEQARGDRLGQLHVASARQQLEIDGDPRQARSHALRHLDEERRRFVDAEAEGADVFVTVVVLAVALVALPFGTAQANPPGAPSGKLVFKFNYIAVPPDTHEGVGCGDGHRVFTELGAAGVIVWTLDANSPIHVEDCLTQSIDGDPATIFADAVGTYTIWVRIHGPNKPDNTLDICRSVEDDFTACEIGSVSLSRTGQDRFRFPQKLFDLGNQEFWLLEPGTNFRIAEIRLIQN